MKGSKLYNLMEQRAAEIRQSDPAFFSSPRWPYALITECADELAMAPASAKPKPATTLPAPKKVTRPAISPASGHETAAVVNPETALKARLDTARKNRDLDEAKAVLRELDALAAKR